MSVATLVGVTMSIHKLTAGSGYTYLTRQVAAQDRAERGHSSLASYYTEKGETPGRWVGSGLAGLGGISAGDLVSEAHMLNLFGAGYHPLAEQLRAAAAEHGADARGQGRAARLGSPFPLYPGDVSEFRVRVAQRAAELAEARGLPAESTGTIEDRARARSEVATALFRERFGRDPVDARELSALVAKESRPRTNAVAGYDLSFSPVKSVSTLWALAPVPVAAVIEAAHDAAVADALTYLERSALFTREGSGGARQVETRGLVAVAFTHRDSRAGDPDLHTHVAVANKVQARDSGRWLAIDGRVLYKAVVAASEVYNTALETHLRDRLGVAFTDVPNVDPRKRPTREIVGVDPALAARWSTRRADITARTSDLAHAFQSAHGRPPSPVEAIQLAQQATLETRDAKHPARSLNEQREMWAGQARQVLGGDHAIRAMVTAALSPTTATRPRVDAAWVRDTAARIAATLSGRRSVWQQVHVYAEAQRQARRTGLPKQDLDRVVGLLVDEVLTTHSVTLARPGADPAEDLPDGLRRSDGTSVYTLAGSTLYTSSGILAAEARIVARAGQRDGFRVPDAAVQAALTAAAREGVSLNAGQATLVREMATSGAWVQLAIAPAGAGKTTAMRALTRAWTEAGGHVLGLAPSAAAAHVLGESIAATTDTLAKLAWHLEHPALADTPAWIGQIGPATLVIVDEAGMADTLTLDTVTEHVIANGGSVRLIGDDQQLAALGAGGVLRDIHATHGSLHLSELMRFTNPAEGAASLALRDGAVEALGFYLDHDRVHVGDLASLADDVFTAWATDRAAGVDALMLAPTRDLVADLNQRARAHRLTTTPGAAADAAGTVVLADGATASVGDTVITRANDRRLPVSGTDFVKNGDRWTITALPGGGNVTVTGIRHRRTCTLPATYVDASVELGYATTIHTAQGVTAATSHTLLTGTESRQLLYTAATRGQAGNHLYLDIVGDPDSHALIRPETSHPRTATDLLEGILARDDSARSATSTAREHDHPAVLLAHAATRYTDAVHHAAEQLLGPARLDRLETGAEQLLPGLTDAPAWPTLRVHLILAAAHGHHPLRDLHDALTRRGVDTAADPAAVLTWRLEQPGVDPRTGVPAPLPWLPAIPPALLRHPTFGPYLVARAETVETRTALLTRHLAATTETPAWAGHGQARPARELLHQVQVWRAATGVDPADRRPTGPTHQYGPLRRYQDTLNRRLATHATPALHEWGPVLDTLLPGHRADAYVPVLAQRLAALSRAGLPTRTLLQNAAAAGPLPDDHAAAALWWRLSGRLSPAVAATTSHDIPLATTWTESLPDLLGADTAVELQASPWWGALVTVIDHALARGHTLDRLLARIPRPEQDLDPCQGLLWRISSLTTPPPSHDDAHDPADVDFADHEVDPGADEVAWAPTASELATLPPIDEPLLDDTPDAPADTRDSDPLAEPGQVEAAITYAALLRQAPTGPLPPSEPMIQAQIIRAIEADTSPVTPERIAALNILAADYYSRAFPGSWAQTYLTGRLAGTDLTGHPTVRPGYAPAGWTRLVDHLGGHGASSEELLAAGLATTTRDGRLIDRFRDRLILPVTRTTATNQEQVLGFVARRHPRHSDHTGGGPKYLNTPDTVLFHKGAQLYTAGTQALLREGVVPVLVEGPLDALAITASGEGGRFLGLAPLGTSFTEEQAHQLATLAHQAGTSPVVAADADPAGQRATQRAYWLLTQHDLTPATVTWAPGRDPADTLARDGARALRQRLDAATPLSTHLLDSGLDGTAREALLGGAAVVAAAPPALWDDGTRRIADATGLPVPVVRRELARALHDRTTDVRAVTQTHLTTTTKPAPATQRPPAVEPQTPPPPAPRRATSTSPGIAGPSR
ncbi:relaxase domain-containing protein [Nostocoides sp. F2B08]|uniref:MobF family relaxase n=1 Tax=Nostocoides sp. F2B08 TaxID=2653936 RepID=UPI0012633F22|nr:MobF family relaxase [Tetrasphaera sp. F2B08]KAB7740361.1 relaxase domain-containing protein [Tetrasphaera sp. F2B08]